MASTVLYPPIVDSYQPAFPATSECTIPFHMSKMNMSEASFAAIHLSVFDAKTGRSVVNTASSTTDRNRMTGVILINIDKTKPLPQSITLTNDDIAGGFAEGGLYRVQIRLSRVSNPKDADYEQTSAWLVMNGNEFSEWSTYTTLKATGQSTVNVMCDAEGPRGFGSYSNTDATENLYSYKLSICKDSLGKNIFEESPLLYSNQNQMSYVFKKALTENTDYYIKVDYTTQNKLSGVIVNQTPFRIDASGRTTSTIESKFQTGQDEDEGRVSLLISLGSGVKKTILKRGNGDSWEDIATIEADGIYYDYTIESDVNYIYKLQDLDDNNDRKMVSEGSVEAIRSLEYSYLVAPARQLKLNFSANISSYTYKMAESVTETLGGAYPVISRNGNLRYRTFPLSALVSLEMDDQVTFYQGEPFFKQKEDGSYQRFTSDHYNYKNERLFREQVIDFLQDGQPKIFKSATEGNMIVLITNVSLSPEAGLNRLLSNVSMTVTEIADYTYENLKKYNLIKGVE